jgi:hypothetical protein
MSVGRGVMRKGGSEKREKCKIKIKNKNKDN